MFSLNKCLSKWVSILVLIIKLCHGPLNNKSYYIKNALFPINKFFQKTQKLRKMAFSVLYRPLAGPTPKRDLKTASGIKFCTLEVILHAQEVAFGHSGCPLTCKSQFLMIEYLSGYLEIWPLVLLRSIRDTRQRRKSKNESRFLACRVPEVHKMVSET